MGAARLFLERAPTRKQPEDNARRSPADVGEVTNSPEVDEIPSQQMAMLVGSAMALSGETKAQNLDCVVPGIGS
jgi:hypothetical protein